MSENKAKKVKEIFSDYQARANIIEAEILNLDVIKKTNTLGITIKYDEYIEIKEIWYFEKFLLERFGFKNIDMRIQYADGVKLKRVDDEWRNIICYMAHKYPLMKPMLLMKSTVEIENNIIHVKMHIKGADFLRAKKTDIELENVIRKLFNKDYKIELEEVMTKEEEIAYQNKIKEIEEKAIEEMEIISGQKPVTTRARKSVANFKLREGMPIGAKVTLRADKMYYFLDKLVSVSLPRVRNFRGVNPNAFDGRGNYALGLKEQIIFPEIEYDKIDQVRGMDVIFVTTAKTDEEARELLKLLGMPFSK